MPAADRRDTYIMVRLTAEEKAMVKAVAKAMWRSPSELARSLLLNFVTEKLPKK